MVASHYNWSRGSTLPDLFRHSSVKHSLLNDYLIDYFLTLVSSPHQDHIKLTIVDGFCGGGRYRDPITNISVPGSPIVILKAIKEAEARVFHTQQRKKPINFDVELICIDEDKSAIDHLKWVLTDEGYGDKLKNESIKLLHGSFDSFSEQVIKRASERSKISGKAIFVLDQYGYSDVPLKSLQTIFSTLAKAEIILTFNVDSLINYLNDVNLNSFERKTGFEGAVSAAELDEKHNPNWRKIIQSKLYQAITSSSRAKFFTPFFIRPTKGHGDFWLLHLSQHEKARDVMANTHWKHNNHFVHYGHAGLDMFGVGYAAKIDKDAESQSAFHFDNAASVKSHNAMMLEIPNYLNNSKDGVRFGDFFTQRCNNSPATKSMVQKAVLDLVYENEVIILNQDNKVSSVRAAIKDFQVIKLKPQKHFNFK